MTRPDYGSPIFAAWRESAGADWDAYVEHSFVRDLGAGTLPREVFTHYLVQDYIFLTHFSRAWALAVVKAETLGEMKAAAATVDGLVNHEMQLHVKICKEAGLSEEQLFGAREEIGNLAYTRYVLDAGFSGDYLDLIAALAPCVFGYGEIGLRLGETAAADTPYREWIETYRGEEYQQICHTVGEVIEKAAWLRLGDEPSANPRWAILCRKFAQATRLEVGFWDMGLAGPSDGVSLG